MYPSIDDILSRYELPGLSGNIGELYSNSLLQTEINQYYIEQILSNEHLFYSRLSNEAQEEEVRKKEKQEQLIIMGQLNTERTRLLIILERVVDIKRNQDLDRKNRLTMQRAYAEVGSGNTKKASQNMDIAYPYLKRFIEKNPEKVVFAMHLLAIARYGYKNSKKKGKDNSLRIIHNIESILRELGFNSDVSTVTSFLQDTSLKTIESIGAELWNFQQSENVHIT